MGGMIVLELAAAHPDCVGAIVMVDSTLPFSPDRYTAVEAVAAGIEAGDQGPRRQWIDSMFLPNSDRQLVEKVMRVMSAAPAHVAASVIRGVLEFDCQTAAALCKVPAL